jgi:hypothetical protein
VQSSVYAPPPDAVFQSIPTYYGPPAAAVLAAPFGRTDPVVEPPRHRPGTPPTAPVWVSPKLQAVQVLPRTESTSASTSGLEPPVALLPPPAHTPTSRGRRLQAETKNAVSSGQPASSAQLKGEKATPAVVSTTKTTDKKEDISASQGTTEVNKTFTTSKPAETNVPVTVQGDSSKQSVSPTPRETPKVAEAAKVTSEKESISTPQGSTKLGNASTAAKKVRLEGPLTMKGESRHAELERWIQWLEVEEPAPEPRTPDSELDVSLRPVLVRNPQDPDTEPEKLDTKKNVETVQSPPDTGRVLDKEPTEQGTMSQEEKQKEKAINKEIAVEEKGLSEQDDVAPRVPATDEMSVLNLPGLPREPEVETKAGTSTDSDPTAHTSVPTGEDLDDTTQLKPPSYHDILRAHGYVFNGSSYPTNLALAICRVAEGGSSSPALPLLIALVHDASHLGTALFRALDLDQETTAVTLITTWASSNPERHAALARLENAEQGNPRSWPPPSPVQFINAAADKGWRQVVCQLLDARPASFVLGPVEVQTLLLAHGYRPHDAALTIQSPHCALAWAAARGEPTLAEVLLAGGASVLPPKDFDLAAYNDGLDSYYDSAGWRGRLSSPLHRAIERRHYGLATWLLEEFLLPDPGDAEIDGLVALVDFHGKTLLSLAAEKGETALARCFLELGAAIEAVDQLGRTPLHQAARGGKVGVLRLLLERGADIEAKDRTGRTALDRATAGRRSDAAALLRNPPPAIPMPFEGEAPTGVQGMVPRELCDDPPPLVPRFKPVDRKTDMLGMFEDFPRDLVPAVSKVDPMIGALMAAFNVSQRPRVAGEAKETVPEQQEVRATEEEPTQQHAEGMANENPIPQYAVRVIDERDGAEPLPIDGWDLPLPGIRYTATLPTVPPASVTAKGKAPATESPAWDDDDFTAPRYGRPAAAHTAPPADSSEAEPATDTATAADWDDGFAAPRYAGTRNGVQRSGEDDAADKAAGSSDRELDTWLLEPIVPENSARRPAVPDPAPPSNEPAQARSRARLSPEEELRERLARKARGAGPVGEYEMVTTHRTLRWD